MAHDPTDTVHRFNATARIDIRNAFQTAHQLAPRKTQLGNQRMDHHLLPDFTHTAFLVELR
jgi:hypothetical protein